MNEETIVQETQENSNTESLPPPGIVREMGLLDLRFAQTPDDFAHITGLYNIGCVLIPTHLATALTRIPMKNVGSIIPVPDNIKMNLQVGQIKLPGEALAGGDPETVLFIIGQAFLTTPVTSIGYKEVWIHGQLLAVRGSEPVLVPKLGQMTGQVFYVSQDPRIFMGDTTISREFLELLPEPKTFLIMGCMTLAEDITPELLKSKVPEIVLMGLLRVPPPLLSLAEVLTVEKMGEIISTAEETQSDAEPTA